MDNAVVHHTCMMMIVLYNVYNCTVMVVFQGHLLRNIGIILQRRDKY